VCHARLHDVLISSCPLATSVNVERVFSTGRILLSHIRNRLSVQTTRTLMCVGSWSKMGYIRDKDVKMMTVLPEVYEDEMLEDGWDTIK
jgi:hAT family C-terminal dimerisation region